MALEDVEQLLLRLLAQHVEPQLSEELLLVDLLASAAQAVHLFAPLPDEAAQHSDPLLALRLEVELQLLAGPEEQKVVLEGLSGDAHDLGRLVEVELHLVSLSRLTDTFSLRQPSR